MPDSPQLLSVALASYYASAALLLASLLVGWLALVGGRPALGFATSTHGSPTAGEAGTRVSLAQSTGRWLLLLSLSLLSLSLVARALAAGRPPLASQYEFALAFAWAVIGAATLLSKRRDLAPGSQVAGILGLMLLLYASTLPSTLLPLVPALQNPLILSLHVGTAVVAYAANAVAFGAAFLFLLCRLGRARNARWSRRLPGERVLDELSHRAVMVGFPMLAATLLLGSWWSAIAWGSYWSWDPKQSSTLATWLIYAVYLHTRVRREWQETPSALLLILGFATTIFTYAGNLFFSGMHSYSGI